MWHSPRESRGLSASENVGPPDGGNFRPETLGSTSVYDRKKNHYYHFGEMKIRDILSLNYVILTTKVDFIQNRI